MTDVAAEVRLPDCVDVYLMYVCIYIYIYYTYIYIISEDVNSGKMTSTAMCVVRIGAGGSVLEESSTISDVQHCSPTAVSSKSASAHAGTPLRHAAGTD